jgi:hypothetical protein
LSPTVKLPPLRSVAEIGSELPRTERVWSDMGAKTDRSILVEMILLRNFSATYSISVMSRYRRLKGVNSVSVLSALSNGFRDGT